MLCYVEVALQLLFFFVHGLADETRRIQLPFDGSGLFYISAFNLGGRHSGGNVKAIRLSASLPVDHSSRRNPISSRAANWTCPRPERRKQDTERDKELQLAGFNKDEEMRSVVLLCACSFLIGVEAAGRYVGLEFLEPCSRRDSKLESCLAKSANVLTEHFRLVAALNLFINSNSQELLKEMKPDLRRKLVQVMSTFVEKLFAQVPYDAWIRD